MTAPAPKRIRVLIVDDEPLAREGIRLLLAGDSEVEIVGEIGDGTSAVRAIAKQAPDLVLLDVQMPERDGLQVLREIAAESMPMVVFVTAHDQYAIDAFEGAALDYLLKPISPERFTRTMQRIKDAFRLREMSKLTARLLALARTMPESGFPGAKPAAAGRIPVTVGGRIQFVEIAQIDWVEGEDYYVRLHTGKTSHLIRKTLTALEAELDPHTFARIHRSTIVNISRIREMRPHARGEYVIILQDGTELKLSRTYRDRLAGLLP
jgi:two-component system LytT family response regulator